ncbi:hypothetical protein [Providencia sp. PROV255]|uniref:hypothetical protein n=1 Tax=Providencia sp. PROV255 TaxID=2949943 RepID=UPI00234B261B|nr:hypothetical protein [Providencia sp. PROV255]
MVFGVFFSGGVYGFGFETVPKTGAKRGGKPLSEYYPCHILRIALPDAILRYQFIGVCGRLVIQGGSS